MREGLKEIAELFALGEGIHLGKELFIDLNKEVENTNIQIATMLRANDLAGSFKEATHEAHQLHEEFVKFAVTSPVTAHEISQFAAGVTSAVAQAGGEIKDVTTISEQGIVAAKAFGENAETASLQISTAIQRGAHAREMFAKTLIQTQHLSLEQFNAMDVEHRMKTIEKALTSPAIKEAAAAFGRSWEGRISTLKDIVEQWGMHTGQELFEGLKDEMGHLNDWLLKNKSTLDDIGHTVSHVLVEGFHAVKSAFMFIVEHKDVLLPLAEVFVGLKAVGIGGQTIAGGIKTLTTSIHELGSAHHILKGGFEELTTNVGNVAGALTTFYVALQALADMVDAWHKEGVDNSAERAAFEDKNNRYLMARAEAGADTSTTFGAGLAEHGKAAQVAVMGELVESIHQWGAYTKDAQVDWAKFSTKVQQLNIDPEAAKAMGPAIAEAFKMFSADDTIRARLGLGKFDEESEKRKHRPPAKVNVTIHKIEVASPDPDRFAFSMEKSFKKLAANPTAAADALKEL